MFIRPITGLGYSKRTIKNKSQNPEKTNLSFKSISLTSVALDADCFKLFNGLRDKALKAQTNISRAVISEDEAKVLVDIFHYSHNETTGFLARTQKMIAYCLTKIDDYSGDKPILLPQIYMGNIVRSVELLPASKGVRIKDSSADFLHDITIINRDLNKHYTICMSNHAKGARLAEKITLRPHQWVKYQTSKTSPKGTNEVLIFEFRNDGSTSIRKLSDDIPEGEINIQAHSGIMTYTPLKKEDVVYIHTAPIAGNPTGIER